MINQNHHHDIRNAPWLERKTLLRSARKVFVARWKPFLFIFLLTFVSCCVATALTKRTWQTSATLLLKKERISSPITPEQTFITGLPDRNLSEEDLNSEVELLKSHSLLEQLIRKLNLDKETPAKSENGLLVRISKLLGEEKPSLRAEALTELKKSLTVEAVKKSNVIRVGYQGTDPEVAAGVVNTLCVLYQQHHFNMRQPDITKTFFTEQADSMRAKVLDAETALRKISPLPDNRILTQHLESKLRQLNDYEAELHNTRSSIAQNAARIDALEEQIAREPARLQSEERITHKLAPDQVRSQLFSLEIKRSELLAKYPTNHRFVLEVEKELTNARRFISELEDRPADTLTVTSLNITRQKLLENLSNENITLASLKKKEDALLNTINETRNRVNSLANQEYERRQFERDRDQAIQSYQIYAKKGEEARISEGLDRKGIMNVNVAEPAPVPLTPSRPDVRLNISIGLAMGLILGLITTYLLEYFSPTVRTEDDNMKDPLRVDLQVV
ncbi:MAG: GumC family protein [Blastocatellia bacterium]